MRCLPEKGISHRYSASKGLPGDVRISRTDAEKAFAPNIGVRTESSLNMPSDLGEMPSMYK